MSSDADLQAAYEAIDAVNAADPNVLEWHGQSVPRALLQGQRATTWLPRVADMPSSALSIAARAHHLARWQIARASYPDGRAGYLRWRKASKAASAELLVTTLAPLGVATAALNRAVDLIQRVGLGADPEAQAVEDVACLVFLETDYVALLQRLGGDATAGAVRKTLKKMSPTAIGLGVEATPIGPARDLLLEVAATS
ncbi:MAG: DUF4202 domain-containing protein [Actinomycetia bacterium]|nr:DUF4202 domain-containing protein [Actinomycetes bacterium]